MGTLACYATLRGQGWSWGTRPHQLPAPLPRQGLLLRLVRRIIWYQANCAIASWVVKVAEASDGTVNELFDLAGLPHPPYYVHFLIVGFGLGQAAWSGLELGFACTTLVFYAITNALRVVLPSGLRPSPFDVRMYPPLMRSPHSAGSVRQFWSSAWHSMFRRSFTVLGYYPSTTLFGRGALGVFVGTLAAFVISGLAHDFGLNFGVQGSQLTTSGWHLFDSTLWFSSQALVIGLEQGFTAITGRRVGGRAGQIWTLTWMIVSGSFLARSWLNRGLADGLNDPWHWQLWRFVVPFAPCMG